MAGRIVNATCCCGELVDCPCCIGGKVKRYAIVTFAGVVGGPGGDCPAFPEARRCAGWNDSWTLDHSGNRDDQFGKYCTWSDTAAVTGLMPCGSDGLSLSISCAEGECEWWLHVDHGAGGASDFRLTCGVPGGPVSCDGPLSIPFDSEPAGATCDFSGATCNVRFSGFAE